MTVSCVWRLLQQVSLTCDFDVNQGIYDGDGLKRVSDVYKNDDSW